MSVTRQTGEEAKQYAGVFLNNFLTFPQAIALGIQLIEKITNYRQEEYSEQDVSIISKAREIYMGIFKDLKYPASFPIYLKFRSEYINQLNPVEDKKIEPNERRPPYILPKQYDIQSFEFKSGSLSTDCKDGAIELIAYLNGRNQRKTVGDSLACLEGHYSDSVAYLINLLIHAFSAFSHLQLATAEEADLKLANNYITFIKKLRHIDNGKLQQGFIRGKYEDKAGTFEQRVANAEKRFDKIRDEIEKALNSKAIANEFVSLHTKIKNFSKETFKLVLPLISTELVDQEVSIDSIVTAQTSVSTPLANKPFILGNEKITDVHKVLAKLALSLHDFLENKPSARFYIKYTKSTQQWFTPDNVQSGGYSVLTNNSKFMSMVSKFIAMLEQTAANVKQLKLCQDIARIGGDISCVEKSSQYLNQTIRMIEATLTTLNQTWNEIWEYISSEDLKLATTIDKDRNSEALMWKKNFSFLILNNFITHFQSDLKSIIDLCNAIKSKLELWQKNPDSLRQDLDEKIKNLIDSTYSRIKIFKESDIHFEHILSDNLVTNPLRFNEINGESKSAIEINRNVAPATMQLCDWKEVGDIFNQQTLTQSYLDHKNLYAKSSDIKLTENYFDRAEQILIELDEELKKNLKSELNIQKQEILSTLRGKLIHERVGLYRVDNFLKLPISIRLAKYQKFQSDFAAKLKSNKDTPYKEQVKLAFNQFKSLTEKIKTDRPMLESKEQVLAPPFNPASSGIEIKEIPQSPNVESQLKEDEEIVDLMTFALSASIPNEKRELHIKELEMDFQAINQKIKQYPKKYIRDTWNLRLFPQIKDNLCKLTESQRLNLGKK